jgi:hypothetical protein
MMLKPRQGRHQQLINAKFALLSAESNAVPGGNVLRYGIPFEV